MKNENTHIKDEIEKTERDANELNKKVANQCKSQKQDFDEFSKKFSSLEQKHKDQDKAPITEMKKLNDKNDKKVRILEEENVALKNAIEIVKNKLESVDN